MTSQTRDRRASRFVIVGSRRHPRGRPSWHGRCSEGGMYALRDLEIGAVVAIAVLYAALVWHLVVA